MRHALSALVLISFAAACAPQGEAPSSETGAPAVSTEADMQAIAAVRDLEVAAFTAGGNFSYLTSDAVLMAPNEPRVVGLEAIEGWVTMTPAGGNPVSGTNKGIHIYERQADGSSKMAQDVWNADQAN